MKLTALKLAAYLLEDNDVIACDFDGVLAKTVKGKFDKDKIGEPVPEMMKKVKDAIARGKKVVLFTARAGEKENIPPIKAWLRDNELPDLEITNEKLPEFSEFWDDRAREVVRDEGTFAESLSKVKPTAAGIMARAHYKSERLKSKGWTKRDFADVLLGGPSKQKEVGLRVRERTKQA